jgi:hypothetical protein
MTLGHLEVDFGFDLLFDGALRATRLARPSSISAIASRNFPGCGKRSSVGSSNTNRCKARMRSGKRLERIILSAFNLPARSTILSEPIVFASTS